MRYRRTVHQGRASTPSARAVDVRCGVAGNGGLGARAGPVPPAATPNSVSLQWVWCTIRLRAARRWDHQPMGSVGDTLVNVLMESTVGLHKSELIDQHPTFARAPSWNAKPRRCDDADEP